MEVFPLKVNKAHLDMLVSWKPDWMPAERDNPGDVQTADFVGAILEGRHPVSQAYQAFAGHRDCGCDLPQRRSGRRCASGWTGVTAIPSLSLFVLKIKV